jgi:hypothetical protein
VDVYIAALIVLEVLVVVMYAEILCVVTMQVQSKVNLGCNYLWSDS